MYDTDVVEFVLECTSTDEDFRFQMDTIKRAQAMKDQQSACDCDPAARHSLRCEATPLFTQTLYEMAERRGYVDPLGPELAHWDVRWVCTHCDECADIYLHHTGGVINGPAHWCIMQGKFVS